MEYLEFEGRLFEVTILAEARGDERAAIECFEMGPRGGMIGVIRDTPGKALTASLFQFEDVPVPVIDWWVGIARRGRGESEDASSDPTA